MLSISPVFASEKPEIFVQLGHSGGVKSIAISPDGEYMISSGGTTLKLWEVDTGREIRTFFIGDASTVAFSPDGKFALLESYDNTIKLWGVSTGKEIRSFEQNERVFSAVFSPNGKYALSGHASGILKLWEVSTGEEIRRFRHHDRYYVTSVAFSPNGKYALSGSEDKTIKLWDVSTGKEIRTFASHTNGINSVAFSPDGRYVLSGSDDKTLKLWEIETGKEIRTFTGHTGKVNSVAFSPDGKYALSGSGWSSQDNYHFVKLWEIETGREIKSFRQRTYQVNSVAFSPDGRHIFSGNGDGSSNEYNNIQLYEIETGKEIRTFTGHASSVSFALSHNGRHILSGLNNHFKLWDAETGKEVRRLTGSLFYSRPMFLPNDKYALSVDSKKLVLWDVEAGKKVRESTEQSDFIGVTAISPDGKHALSAAQFNDKTIKLWDINTLSVMRTFSGHTGIVQSLAFSPDGKYALSGSDDNTLKLWDVKTGREIRTFTGSSIYPGAIFSPDGKYALSRYLEKLVLWDVETGKKIKESAEQSGYIDDLAFSPDGRYAIAGGREIILYEIENLKEVRIFAGHTDRVYSLAFSRDGRYIFSGSRDFTIRKWEVSPGKEIAQFISFTDGEWVIITPEGYFNASPNGAKHLNVRVGNKVYSIDNFYEKFFNPVYVASVLQGKKVEAVADIRKGILTPPDVKIISPEPNKEFSTDTVTITVSAKDTGGGIDEIRLYHNGKAIGEDTRGVKIVPKPVPASSKQGGSEVIKAYTVTLVDGANTFRATAFSKDRTESNPYELIVKLSAPSKDVSMHVFAVGINKYKNPALNLNYAEPDAKGIADFFRQKGKGLFKNVEIKEIYNEQATKETIISKLRQLENTNPQDAVLIYLAGHGENINDKWYFIPHELTYPEREEHVKTKGISSDELSGLIKNIKAQKILLLIDSCKSGAVLIAFRGFEDRKALSQLSRSTGVHIVAASTKDQFAAEVKELGHGVFTYTLLEGLKGKAAGKGETVTVRKLMGYIEEKLPEITKKYKQEAQFPVVDSRGMDFPLVLIK